MALSSIYESEKKWQSRFMDLADLVASWSKDPSTQVGAVITSGKEVISLGFNGFATRTPDHDHYLDSREEKYPRTIHAEMNAILRMDKRYRPPHPLQIYVTHMPCVSCAAVILAAGITEVVTKRPSDDFMERWPTVDKVTTMFNEAGLKLSFLDI